MKTIVHVNQHVIRRNARTGEKSPPISVRKGRHGPVRYVNSIGFDGPAWLVHSPDKPLPCGARVWIELQDGCEILFEDPPPGP